VADEIPAAAARGLCRNGEADFIVLRSETGSFRSMLIS